MGTDEGIAHLREVLHLPAQVFPATLTKQQRPQRAGVANPAEASGEGGWGKGKGKKGKGKGKGKGKKGGWGGGKGYSSAGYEEKEGEGSGGWRDYNQAPAEGEAPAAEE